MLQIALMVLSWLMMPGNVAVGFADDETSTVEVYFARENVPAEVKTGSRVHLLRLDGRTVTRTGKVSQTTTILASNVVAESVTMVEKPASPEQAVKVVLRVKKNQLRTVERAKTQMVTVMETDSDGNRKTVKKPVTLLLEISK